MDAYPVAGRVFLPSGIDNHIITPHVIDSKSGRPDLLLEWRNYDRHVMPKIKCRCRPLRLWGTISSNIFPQFSESNTAKIDIAIYSSQTAPVW